MAEAGQNADGAEDTVLQVASELRKNGGHCVDSVEVY